MSKNSQNSCQQESHHATPRVLLFASTESELQILRMSLPFPEGTYDAFYNLDDAKKALQKQRYTAILTEETSPSAQIQELKSFANLNGQNIALLCSSQQALSPLNADIWVMSPKRLFVHDRIEADILTPCLSAMFESSKHLGWIHDVHAKFWKMRERLKSTPKKVILLVGDSGTSKYSLAQITHSRSEFRNKPFIFANCKVPGEIKISWGSEEKKAFSTNLMHLLELAQGGTLYFHEVDCLDYEALEVLTSIIKTAAIIKENGTSIPFEGRIICSTRKELEHEIEDDLCPREFANLIQQNVIRIPSLAEYKDEIVEMAQILMNNYCHFRSGKEKEFSVLAKKEIEKHTFGRNIRELFDMIKHAYAMSTGKKISPDAIHLTLHVEKEDTKQERRRKTKLALRKHKGNKRKASDELGISRKSIYNWLNDLGIPLNYK
ncbi:MAG: sigma 54-interacting transcriptional regulator [Muribaculum sp.]|nr:sigma 54-interacting transcriptional regulator [Muribaculum sp.]